ncbi:hypothetical protein CRE_12073 [Caenorhabditis remanei]|uniref:RING-type domain-containing protein n=1 Tax=Caenorhabditis remanei TaxID=31234 RepID=E3MPR6_CAERE|nr:hypothetical protein CRE_12073 [Caenorhabditis remanei]
MNEVEEEYTTRRFKMTHVIESMKEMEVGDTHHGEMENHFGVDWTTYIHRDESELHFGLKCHAPPESKSPWSMITNISLKSNQVLGFSFFELDHCFHTENFQKSENFDDLKRYWEICKEKPLKFNFFVEVTDVSGVPGYDEPMVTLKVNKNKIEVARKTLVQESLHFRQLLVRKPPGSCEISVGRPVYNLQLLLPVLEETSVINDKTVLRILQTAYIFKFPVVVKRCEYFLMERSRKCAEILKGIAERYGLEKLKLHLLDWEDYDNMAYLTCDICKKIFAEIPDTLDCGHSFCRPCILNSKREREMKGHVSQRYKNLKNDSESVSESHLCTMWSSGCVWTSYAEFRGS